MSLALRVKGSKCILYGFDDADFALKRTGVSGVQLQRLEVEGPGVVGVLTVQGRPIVLVYHHHHRRVVVQ